MNWAAHYVIGWFADITNRPKLLAVCMLASRRGVDIVADLGRRSLAALGYSRFCFTAIDASFPVVWATIGDFFGRKYFATIRGTMSFFYTWGSVLGPVVAGAAYDRSQSYATTLWGLGGNAATGRQCSRQC